MLCDLAGLDKVGLGVGVGAGVFFVIFTGIGILEICLKKRAERKDKKLIEDQKKRAKQKRAAKAREVESLPVPGIDLNASMNSTKSIASGSTVTAKSDVTLTAKGTS